MRAFLGTGLLGAAFARAACARQEKVVVWNRSAAKAESLTEAGAAVASSPENAVRNAQRIIRFTACPNCRSK